jgi:thermostable 8-oxoguanine DNA glycosylase
MPHHTHDLSQIEGQDFMLGSQLNLCPMSSTKTLERRAVAVLSFGFKENSLFIRGYRKEQCAYLEYHIVSKLEFHFSRAI